MNAEPDKVYRVAELNAFSARLLEQRFSNIWLEGECSEATQRSRGESIYFTLKDESAQIACVLFKTELHRARTPIQPGQKLRLFGRLSLYARGGQFQFQVEEVLPAGLGELLAKFEQLRTQLRNEGLFDPARKRPLPTLPRHVILVTAPGSAALQDMLRVFRQRQTPLHITICPVPVQGEHAASRIARALTWLNQTPTPPDLIVLARGGGSLQNLWAFNQEQLVRAVAASSSPILTGIGHESDTSLCDLAADLRASTPTAAAVLIAQSFETAAQQLATARRTLLASAHRTLLQSRQHLLRISHHPLLRNPRQIERNARHQLSLLRHRLATAPQEKLHQRQLRMQHLARQLDFSRERQLREARLALDHAARKLEPPLRTHLERNHHQLQRLHAQLRALNPLAVLDRGFSITRNADGTLLRSTKPLQPGDRLITRLASGTVHSIVEQTQQDPPHE